MRSAPATLLVAVVVVVADPAAAQQQFFPAPQPLVSGTSVGKVRVGDYDADGAHDLYVVQVFWAPLLLHNDGTGVFTNVPGLPLPQGSPQDAVFVDFDGDADLDLLVGTAFTMQLFENRGGGVWADASASLPPNLPPFVNAAAGDFDGDGDVDVATVTHPLIGGTNRMLVNQGNGTFTASMPFGSNGILVHAVDFDGDGDLDLVVAGSWPPRSLELWRNDGSMHFTNVSANVPALPYVLTAVGDVDGDGDPDLIAAEWSGGACTLLANDGTGTFVAVPGAVPAVPAGTYSAELADVDADGDPDLVRVDRAATPSLQLALNDGTGRFTAAPSRLPAAASNGLSRALPFDVDRDGDDDLLLSVSLAGVQVLVNRHRQLEAPSPPQRGLPWTVELWSQPGYGTQARAAWLAVGLGRLAAPVTAAPFGLLWLDASVPFAVLPGVVAAGAVGTPFVLPIPPVPAVAGVVLHVQALVEERAGLASARLTAPLSAAIR
jgi:hypothetical protein